MTSTEITHRFKLVAIGYVVFAAFVVAGVWINYMQTQSIKRNADATCSLIKSLEGIAPAQLSAQLMSIYKSHC